MKTIIEIYIFLYIMVKRKRDNISSVVMLLQAMDLSGNRRGNSSSSSSSGSVRSNLGIYICLRVLITTGVNSNNPMTHITTASETDTQ
jgi:hypothetical protein